MLVCAWAVGLSSIAWAITIEPTPDQIEKALERGRQAGKERIPPVRLYAWFGSSDQLKPHGFLMTKTAGLAVLAAHFALRAETPSQDEIDRVVRDPTLLINVVIFGDRPDFALNSYLVLVQGNRTIKPTKVRFDGRASRTTVWPNAPAFRAKVIAMVPYAELEPMAKTKISVFPGTGDEVTFDLDLSQID